ncbi:MAG: hypothetical protein M1831_003027 [Alyxoria varia]|nr:MAG: hypothetical protein M1831_003027 [Alyxoria varia]
MAVCNYSKKHFRLHKALLFLFALQCPQPPLAEARIVQQSEISSSQFTHSPLNWLSKSSSVWLLGDSRKNAGPELRPFEPAELSLIVLEDVSADTHDGVEELRFNRTTTDGSSTNTPDTDDAYGDDRKGEHRENPQDSPHQSNCAYTKQDGHSSDSTSDAPPAPVTLDDTLPRELAHSAEHQDTADILASSAPYKRQKQDSDLKPYPENHQPPLLKTTAPNEKQKRQSNPCADDYAQCAQAGEPGLCCPSTAICSADQSGNVGCCPLGAACTGTIGVVPTETASAATTASAGGSGGGVVVGGGAAGGGDGGGASVTAAVVGGTQTDAGVQETGSAGGEVILGAGATSLRRDLLSMERWWGLGWLWSLGVAVGLASMAL